MNINSGINIPKITNKIHPSRGGENNNVLSRLGIKIVLGKYIVDTKKINLTSEQAIYVNYALSAMNVLAIGNTSSELDHCLNWFIKVVLSGVLTECHSVLIENHYQEFQKCFNHPSIVREIMGYCNALIYASAARERFHGVLESINGANKDFMGFIINGLCKGLFNGHSKFGEIIKSVFKLASLQNTHLLYLSNSLCIAHRENNLFLYNELLLKLAVKHQLSNVLTRFIADIVKKSETSVGALRVALASLAQMNFTADQFQYIFSAIINTQTKSSIIDEALLFYFERPSDLSKCDSYLIKRLCTQYINPDLLSDSVKASLVGCLRRQEFQVDQAELMTSIKNYIIFHLKDPSIFTSWLIPPHLAERYSFFGYSFAYHFEDFDSPKFNIPKLSNLNLEYCFSGFGTYSIVYDPEPKFLIVCSRNGLSTDEARSDFENRVRELCFGENKNSLLRYTCIDNIRVYDLKNTRDDYPTLIEVAFKLSTKDLPIWLQSLAAEAKLFNIDNYKYNNLINFVLNDLITIIKKNNPDTFLLIEDMEIIIKQLIMDKGEFFIASSALVVVVDKLNNLYSENLQIELNNRLDDFCNQLSEPADILKLGYLFGQIAKKGVLGYEFGRTRAGNFIDIRNIARVNADVEFLNSANIIFYLLAFHSLKNAKKRFSESMREFLALEAILSNLEKGYCIDIESKMLLIEPFKKYKVIDIWEKL